MGIETVHHLAHIAPKPICVPMRDEHFSFDVVSCVRHNLGLRCRRFHISICDCRTALIFDLIL